MTLKSTNQCAPNRPRGFSNMADIDFFQDGSDDNVEDAYGFDDGMGDSDENLTPLQRLEKYLEDDNIFNRQMVARSMLDTLRACGEEQESCRAVLDCMARLSHDTEPSVRSELMEQVPHIAVYCQENKALFTDAMPMYILPMVVRYLNDANNQVRKTSQAALLVLLEQGLVEKEDIELQVVSVILELASPSSHDDYRTEAVALMSKMAPLLGRDITERMFLPRFCEMVTDPLFHVRKVCASNFGEVCSVVGVENSEEVLLPKFYNLCGDGVWGVRKACAECFMTISCACSLETRRQYLANLFVDLLADQSRWVRMSAFQQLGPFISTFADPRLTGLYVREDGNVVLQEGDIPALRDRAENVHREGTEEKPEFDVEAQHTQSQQESQLSEEMDIEEEEGGEGLSEGKLVMEVGADNMSVEEKRAGHIHKCSASDNQASPSKEEKEEGSLEDQMSSLKVEDSGEEKSQQSHSDSTSSSSPSRTKEDKAAESDIGESKVRVVIGSGKANDEASCDNKCADGSEQPCDDDDDEDLDNASMASQVSSSESQTLSSVASQAGGDEDAFSSVSTAASSSTGGGDRVHVHLDKDSFNTFQFWRSPLPEVDIDFDVINGAPANIHVVAKVKDEEKHKVYSTHVDVVMSADGSSASGCSSTQITDGTLRREMDLHGVRIHTASVSTVSDTDETVRNIGSTNVLGEGLGECTLAVVDGVVKDLSGNSNLGYIDTTHHQIDDSVLAQQQDIIPQSLLENYLGMVEPSRAQTVDTEITRHCAYNLPAVAYTLGRQNWHCIKQLYETLAQAMQWKVRRTLAFSIHEMALIEGEEITHRDLLPVFDGFIKDLDEVRIGVLKHLADFLRLLRPGVRQQYLPKLGDFMKTDNHRNWRFRKELAEQLNLLCELYDSRSIMRHICPLSVQLCLDKVAEVRIESFNLMSCVLRRVHDENEDNLLQVICTDIIEQLALNSRWSNRQIFCQMCHVVVRQDSLPAPVFAELLLPSLLALGHDSIPNVRLAVARVLAQSVMTNDFFTASDAGWQEELEAVVQALQTDRDRDVRYFSTHRPDLHPSGLPGYDTLADQANNMYAHTDIHAIQDTMWQLDMC